MERYRDFLKNLELLCESLPVDFEDVAKRFDGDFVLRWEQLHNRYEEINTASQALVQQLKQWESRRWMPIPSEGELANWQHHSQIIGEELSTKSIGNLQVYRTAIEHADTFWQRFDQWIAAAVLEPLSPTEFHDWLVAPIPSIDPGNPVGWISKYVRYDEIDILKTELEKRKNWEESSDLSALLILADLSEKIPNRYRQSGLRVGREIDKVTQQYIDRIKNAVTALGNPEDVAFDHALDVIQRIGKTLPQLSLSGEHSWRFPLLSNLELHLNQLRMGTIILAERIYSDLQFKQDESSRKKLIGELLNAPYIRDTKSDRRTKLLRWAEDR